MNYWNAKFIDNKGFEKYMYLPRPHFIYYYFAVMPDLELVGPLREECLLPVPAEHLVFRQTSESNKDYSVYKQAL